MLKHVIKKSGIGHRWFSFNNHIKEKKMSTLNDCNICQACDELDLKPPLAVRSVCV